ncbi:CLIP domain-containing serine protease B4-like [Uranotaenia lowii]|uniref:CLIP domain-containing serine protease B4-like n=1 Tax=Uranotaenia lowii TaxID=190385 RepID=UPI00247959F8|nr:CLIP domain-containing serine protease B4-like [Uranotaenia lowii]
MVPKMGLLMPALFLLMVQLGHVLTLEPNEPCVDPNGQSGSCVFLRECPAFVAIFSQGVVSPDQTEFVQSSRCGSSGGKPLLCCAGINVANRVSGSSALPKPPNCGIDLADRIVGGQPTALDEYPWATLINYRKPNGNTGFHCGGSLINSRYVITAGHCINAIPRGWTVIGVRLGEYDLKHDGQDCLESECADVPVDVDVEKIIVHEEYNPQNKNQYNDIALIRMVRDVSFSSYISPICLPVAPAERNKNNVGTKAVAAGWGRTETASQSSVKLKVELDITDFNKCASVYRNSQVTLRDTQLCAGGLRGKDTCSGDSGGPLMKRVVGNIYLYGIVSFGPNKCGTKDVPGVYTNVPKFIDWIQAKLQ